jgi:hypothetical protein
MPLSIRRGSNFAWTTPSVQPRQPYLGRIVRSTRRIAGITSSLKGVGRIYQQTFIDTYAKVAAAKLYDRRTPITAADLLNDRVIPFFESREVKLMRILTDRGSEYCGNPERREYDPGTPRPSERPKTMEGARFEHQQEVVDNLLRSAFPCSLYHL